MMTGNIVEYIEQQKIISAVILQAKNGRLRLLNENNREVNFSEKRLAHISSTVLDTAMGRNDIVANLKTLSENRARLSREIDIRELWEILHEEPDEIDISTMTLFCFDPPLTSDHESAVIRAFFNDRLYFKFNKLVFIPYTEAQVEERQRQVQAALKKEQLAQKGAAWIQAVLNQRNGSTLETDPEVVSILKSYYLFNTDAPDYLTAREIIRRSALNTPEQLFSMFVKAGVWDEHKNVDLLTLQIPTRFSSEVLQHEKILRSGKIDLATDALRRDLTHVPLITIDGQSTLDFDDAISLEVTDTGYTLGVHIIDVDAFIKKHDPIDLAARERGSSIYMPDDKLPMLPPNLSEDLCSLKEGATRPGISTIIRMNRFFEILDYEIIPSIIRVHQQMSYAEANLLNGQGDPITTLYKMATMLREKRLKAGAVQITLPEVNVWIEENNEIGYAKIDRENPSRMLISEMMILANTLAAQFLAENDIPAVFRSQAPPKQRLFKGIETSLSLNFMQRKQLSRAMIGTRPDAHSGLGVKAYTTATSPIRRYHDLLTQRQLKAILGYGTPYSRDQLEQILQEVSIPMANASRVQAQRKRYWIIKYLESKKGETFDAMILDVYRDTCNVLVKEFMLETAMPLNGMKLQQGDLVRVTIQHADARRGQLSLFA